MHVRCASASLHIHRPASRVMRWPNSTALMVAMAASIVVGVSCGGAHEPRPVGLTVVAVDRTGVAHSSSWPVEVASQVMSVVETALDHHVDQIELIGIGSNQGDTQRLATIDLTGIDGNTRAKREAAREQVVAAAGATARRIAEAPVPSDGTDVIAALAEAAELCQDPAVGSCSIVLASDLEDQRVTGAASPDAAVAALGPLMPALDGIPVSITGLGASGADSALVTKVSAAWEELLHGAGATDVRIARSL